MHKVKQRVALLMPNPLLRLQLGAEQIFVPLLHNAVGLALPVLLSRRGVGPLLRKVRRSIGGP